MPPRHSARRPPEPGNEYTPGKFIPWNQPQCISVVQVPMAGR
jgi:hypothetical protein